MKLTVNREQIRAALEKLYQTDVEDFTIIPSTPSTAGKRCRGVVVLPYMSITKVPNIKGLRNLAVQLNQRMTLMEGKWAIENWEKFLSFVDEYNRLPLGGYGAGDNTGILK